MEWIIIIILLWGFWITNKHIRRGTNMAVTSIQDFKNQADSKNLGVNTKLDSILTKVEALKALIIAGGSTPADQLALLDAVLADVTSNDDKAASVDAAANPPTL